MTFFSEEVEHDGPRAKYSVGKFSDSKDTWEKVSYENSGKLNVSCSCDYSKQMVSFIDIYVHFVAQSRYTYTRILYIYYRDGGWMPVIKIL